MTGIPQEAIDAAADVIIQPRSIGTGAQELARQCLEAAAPAIVAEALRTATKEQAEAAMREVVAGWMPELAREMPAADGSDTAQREVLMTGWAAVALGAGDTRPWPPRPGLRPL